MKKVSNTAFAFGIVHLLLVVTVVGAYRLAFADSKVSVNRELILLDWHIGGEILRCQNEQGWGAKVVDRLSRDLRVEFPEMGGFSIRNLLRMRAFANAYPAAEIVQQAAAQIP